MGIRMVVSLKKKVSYPIYHWVISLSTKLCKIFFTGAPVFRTVPFSVTFCFYPSVVRNERMKKSS